MTAPVVASGAWLSVVINVGIPVGLIAATWLIGRLIERAHYRRIQRREQALRDGGLVMTNLKRPPEGYRALEQPLFQGSVVIGSSYFKRFAAGLKTLIGGRLRTLETLLERARREAVLRMGEQAREAGAEMVANVRIETATIGFGFGGDKGFAAAEIIAYGTALKRER